ncbi:alkaline phosphatase family protein [Amnibacterium sp.]|uniref:alkaline phosphatase family protein n=1 Tax=Amnibacterium sp. TaxID=1872496 RepID=UPI003F7C7160
MSPRRALASAAAALAALTLLAGCTTAAPRALPVTSSGAPTGTPASPGAVPRPAHLVVVVLENHAFDQVAASPYLAQLERSSAVFTDAHANAHPSEPNYFALWSGSTHGLISDACPVSSSAESLGSQLLAAHRTVAGYFESMPRAGFRGCTAGRYVRKHNPLAAFPATADAAHMLPFSAFPQGSFDRLPDVALVVPNLDHDMHDGSVAAGDAWLRREIGPYASWAQHHDSALVVTWDENDDAPGNRILTLVAGQHVVPGRYRERVDHVRVLHTIEAAFGLVPLGAASAPITDIWR